ncbi:MAG: hypothetical protein HKP61_22765 [Dactylosporangium sp.]|nr:hypothetical protein [Dactylosporangium sp.]NNJ63700.1 hypothetical protein [Dactylosporangium sp.]
MTVPQNPPTGPYDGQQPPAGQPAPGWQPSPGQPPAGPPAPTSSGAGKILLKVFGGLAVLAVVVVVGAVALWLSRDEPAKAAVGDCLTGQSADELKNVACDDSAATFKIVGKIDEMTQDEWQAKDDPCPDFPTAESSYWEGEAGKTGYVLCLEPVTE